MLECPKGCCQIAMPDDVFCGMCGTKLEEVRKCPACEYRLFLSDVFCRKCGKSVAGAAVESAVALPPGIWQCGCGHVNDCNLATCAQCGRTPSESAAAAAPVGQNDDVPF